MKQYSAKDTGIYWVHQSFSEQDTGNLLFIPHSFSIKAEVCFPQVQKSLILF